MEVEIIILNKTHHIQKDKYHKCSLIYMCMSISMHLCVFMCVRVCACLRVCSNACTHGEGILREENSCNKKAEVGLSGRQRKPAGGV